MNEVLKNIIDDQKKNIKVDAAKGHDKKCPFTGNMKLHGKMFKGIVVSKDTHRTVKVTWSNKHFVKKYERFMVKRTKVAAHNPDAINAQVGDEVVIAECRPLSKTKKFIVVQNLGHSTDYMIKKESIEDDKKVKKEKEAKKKDSDNEVKEEATEALDSDEIVEAEETEADTEKLNDEQ